MRTAITIEYRKFVSTRMWWVLLLMMTVYMAFLAGVMALTMSISVEGADVPSDADPVSAARSIYTIATALGYVFPAIIGAMSVTSEFRHKSITPSLLAEQNRTRLIGAKMAASIPIGLLYGLAGTLAGVLVGGVILEVFGDGAFLSEPSVWSSIGLSIVALTLWTTVGVGLGTMLSNQVAVIVVLLAFTQFVEPVLRALLSSVADGALSGVASYLPGAAGEAITGASFYSTVGMGDLLPWWAGALVLVAYALVAAAIGRATTFRRDFT